MTSLNHTGILLLLIIVIYIRCFFNDEIRAIKGFNMLDPLVVSLIIFSIFELIYWVIDIFFIEI